MKTLIIYSSVHGNTEKIAKAIAEVMNAELKKVDDAIADDIKNYDLIGFGSGIYYGRHHKNLLKFAENANGNGKKAFIFSTSSGKKLPIINNFDKALLKKLSKRGFTVIGNFNCRGKKAYYNTPGLIIRPFCGQKEEDRPNAEDIEKAKKFAENMKKLFSETTRLS